MVLFKVLMKYLKILKTHSKQYGNGNKILIDMAADRGRFICQSQSLNLFVEKPNFNNLSICT